MSQPESHVRHMLEQAGVTASDVDIAMVTAIASAAPPRPSPQRDTEPQLVQRPERWNRS